MPSGIHSAARHTPALLHPQQRTAPTAGEAATSRPAPAGSGARRIGPHAVPVTPLNQSGFVSSFRNSHSARIHHLSQLGINPAFARQVLSAPQLRDAAANDVARIRTMALDAFPTLNHITQQAAHAALQRTDPRQHRDINAALDDYRSTDGGHVLMSISAMGFPDLRSYLHSIDPDRDEEEHMQAFVHEFATRYNCLSGYESDEEEAIDDVRSRLEGLLPEQARTLTDYLHQAPRLSNVPLMRGSGGGDNPLRSLDNTLRAMLRGESLHFNSFLSTTASYEAAMDFTGKLSSTGFGTPLYTIDFSDTQNEARNEVLRRDALQALDNGECDDARRSLLYLIRPENAAGVSVNATEQALNPHIGQGHITGQENEILLAPGHIFIPQQLIRHDDGFIAVGALRYARDANTSLT
ncbi:hypothetical protein [Siccibacter turicensis]|uniref:hypothetical protein n=1 Tax=Siccibacter turicensis TaxID=357233 RepID=UPI003F550FD9